MYKLTIVYKKGENYTMELHDHEILIAIAEEIILRSDDIIIGYKITKNKTILNLMSFNKKYLTKIVNA